jgi:hypothetical protein
VEAPGGVSEEVLPIHSGATSSLVAPRELPKSVIARAGKQASRRIFKKGRADPPCIVRF